MNVYRLAGCLFGRHKRGKCAGCGVTMVRRFDGWQPERGGA